MPNTIKYSTSPQTLALKKGNFWIGTGDTDKGPTVTTDYWNGITPPTNGYTVYLNKASNGPSIYTPPSDSDLIVLTRTLSGQTFATGPSALNWYNTQTDKMVFNIDYPAVVTSGLNLALDAGFTPSFPRGGTTWYSVGPEGGNGSLVNGPTYDSADGGSIVFDATDDICTFPVGTFNSGEPQNGTYYFRIKYPPYPSVQNQLFNESGAAFNNGIVYYRNAATTANRYFFVNYYNNTTGTVSSVTTTAPNNLFAGEWADTAFTFNSSGGWAVYKNGTLVNSGTASNFVSWKRDGTGVPRIKCSSPDGSGSQQLFYYYNKALTGSEILQNYQAFLPRYLGTNIVSSGLTLYTDAGYFYSYPGTGTTLTNVSGASGANAELLNGVAYSSDNGGTFLYDNTDDYIRIAANNNLQPANSITLEVWFKSLGANGRTQGLLYPNFGIGLRLETTGGLNARVNSMGSIQFFTTSTTYFNGQWNMASMTLSTAGTITFYVNGSFVQQNSVSYDGNSPFNTSVGGIGTDVNDAANRGINGYIGPCKVYNRVLSPSEVLQNFNAQKSRFGL